MAIAAINMAVESPKASPKAPKAIAATDRMATFIDRKVPLAIIMRLRKTTIEPSRIISERIAVIATFHWVCSPSPRVRRGTSRRRK